MEVNSSSNIAVDGLPKLELSTFNSTYNQLSKRKNNINAGQTFRPKRSLFCFTLNSPVRRACIAIVEWKPFDFFILINIFATCGVLAAYDPMPSHDSKNATLEKVEYFFIAVFTIECILKIMADGFAFHQGAYLRNWWNVLDFLIVVIGLVTLVFESYIEVDVKALRAFRVLRPLRLVSGLPSLQIVLTSILKALVPLFYIAMLVIFVIIIYSIIGVELFMGKLHYACVNETTNEVTRFRPCSISSKVGYQCKNGTVCKDVWEGPNFGITSFDHVGLAALAVFTSITKEGWTDVFYLIEDSLGGAWVWIYFVTLIIWGSFFVLNLVLGVLSGEFAKEKARQTKSGKYQKIREKRYVDDAVKGYTEWIQQAEDLEQDQNINEIKFYLDGRRFTTVKPQNDILGLEITPKMQDALCQYGRFYKWGKRLSSFHKRSHRLSRKIVKSQTFYWAVIIAVFLNSLVLAVEHYNEPEYITIFLNRANYFFLALFTFEMLLKIYSNGFHGYWLSLFNRYDFFVVISSLLEVSITIPTKMPPIGISVLRCVRLLRIFKVTRYWQSLKNFVDALINSIKSIASLLLLLSLFILIFALLGMQIFGGKYELPRIEDKPRSTFDSFWRALITVFQILTGEDWNSCMYIGIKSWGGINKPESILAIVYFVCLVVIGNYILLNVFLAIAVDNLGDAEDMTKLDEEEKIRKKELKEKLLKGNQSNTKIERNPTIDLFVYPSTDTEKASEIGESFDDDQHIMHKKIRPLKLSEANKLKKVIDPMPIARSLFLFTADSRFRRGCYRLCTNAYFLNMILVMIFLSSILLAAEDPLDLDVSRNTILDYFDYVFTSIFTLEILIKIIAYGAFVHKGSFCRAFFNVLDLLIVSVSLISIFIGKSDDMSVVRIFRVIRVLRPLRAINRAQGLKHVIQCVILAVKKIGNIMLVTFLFQFLFAVIGIQLFKGTFSFCNDTNKTTKVDCIGMFVDEKGMNKTRKWETHEFNFDNIFEAMTTLFVVMTFEGWPGILYNAIDSKGVDVGPVKDNRPLVAIYFVIYIIIIAFFMVNIFVGFVIVTFKSEGEEEFKNCELDKNQRNCIDYVLSIRPVSRFVPQHKVQYHIWRIVTSKQFEYMIFGFIVGNTIVLAGQVYKASPLYARILDGFNIGFTMVFLFEFVLSLTAYGPKNYVKDLWNIFDFVIVLGSIIDIILTEIYHGHTIKFNFFRLFRGLRLVKLLSKGAGIRKLLWTFMKSFQALPYVGLLIVLLFFIYAVIGMQVFGTISIDNDDSAINQYNNFQTFAASAFLLFRSATGENWQQIMKSCTPKEDVVCQIDNTRKCGSYFAYVYFMSFNMICSFLIINLFVAVIMDNFDYLTRDWSILGPHHLEEYVRTWSEYDPNATGRMKHIDIVTMLKRIEPPLGFGKCCPHREACKRLVSMNMMMNNDGTVDFHSTLFALIRTSLNIKRPEAKSNMVKENYELRKIIKHIWPRTSPELIDKILPKPECDEGITVGKFYATFLIQEYFRRFKKKRQEERRKKNAETTVSLMAGIRILHSAGPKLRRTISGELGEEVDFKRGKRRSFIGSLTNSVRRSLTFTESERMRNMFRRRPSSNVGDNANSSPLLNVHDQNNDLYRHSYHGCSSYQNELHKNKSESLSADELSRGLLKHDKNDNSSNKDVNNSTEYIDSSTEDIHKNSEEKTNKKSFEYSNFRRPSLRFLPPTVTIDSDSVEENDTANESSLPVLLENSSSME